MYKYAIPMLAIAASMGSTAQAADFDINDDTTVSVFGAVELKYNTADEVDSNGDTSSTSDLEDNGSVVGVGAEHRFDNGLTAYVSAEYVYNVLGDDGDFERDESFFGVRGDFGDIRAGQYDNLFILATYDLIDPFESASLSEESASPDDSTLAYFSPDFNGFSFEAQTRVDGDRQQANNNTDDNDFAFIGVAKYTADRWALHASVDDRGTDFDANGDQYDPSYGLAGVVNVTDRLDLAGRYSTESDADENETAFYGMLASFDYGQGELYGAAQEVDPDGGDSRTEFALGANYLVADNFYVFTEYGDYDQSVAGETDSLAEAGLVYEF